MPVAAAPGMEGAVSMHKMTDCADCDTGPMARGEPCTVIGVCMAMPAALQAAPLMGAFEPRARDMPRSFDDPALSGGRPAPMLEPPRPLA